MAATILPSSPPPTPQQHQQQQQVLRAGSLYTLIHTHTHAHIVYSLLPPPFISFPVHRSENPFKLLFIEFSRFAPYRRRECTRATSAALLQRPPVGPSRARPRPRLSINCRRCIDDAKRPRRLINNMSHIYIVYYIILYSRATLPPAFNNKTFNYNTRSRRCI